MNIKSIKRFAPSSLALAVAVAMPLFATAAHADTVLIPVPATVSQAAAPVTRAEVRADLAVYMASGLQQLDREHDFEPDTNSKAYKKDFATYTYLRSSPQFAVLVDDIQQGKNARVAIAGDALRVSVARQ